MLGQSQKWSDHLKGLEHVCAETQTGARVFGLALAGQIEERVASLLNNEIDQLIQESYRVDVVDIRAWKTLAMTKLERVRGIEALPMRRSVAVVYHGTKIVGCKVEPLLEQVSKCLDAAKVASLVVDKNPLDVL